MKQLIEKSKIHSNGKKSNKKFKETLLRDETQQGLPGPSGVPGMPGLKGYKVWLEI